jgi:NADPH:quinone reductase-like Zn-dependent oxidoreductase
MKSIGFHVEGSFGIERLTKHELDLGPLEPHAVRVTIRAVSLNFRDLMMVRGQYNPRQPLPLVPCSDGAGEVVEVGSAVRRFRVGDRVTTCFFQRYVAGEPTKEKIASTLGGPLPGTLRTVGDFTEDGLVATPAYLDDEGASTLPCAALTAWNALVEQGGLRTGQTVLLQGTGGVSLAALQIARMVGAQVILTSRSAEKLTRARELGLLGAIDTSATDDWAKAARALTEGGVGVDHVVEVGGAGTLQGAIRALRPGGTISVIGVLTGASTELALTPLLMQNLRLQGVLVGTREMHQRMNAAYAASRVQPIVAERFCFDDAPAAFEAMARGTHYGKIVLTLPR